MMKLASLFAVLVPLIAIADPETPKQPKPAIVERARFEIQPSGKPFKQIAIENPLGDVRVEGYDGTSIQIETRKQGPTDEALDRLRVSLVPNPDGTVRMKTTADGGAEYQKLSRDQVRIDLIVRAPREARIEAVSSSGALEVVNMDAGGDLDTASGRITVRNVAGELTTHSVTGATSLTQVFGSVDAQIIQNDLALDSIGGERLIASVNQGKIEGRRIRSRNIELTTMQGNIVFEGEASTQSRFIIASVKGDVDVKLRRTGLLVIRGKGTKVNFGATMKTQARSDGWVEAKVGVASAAPQPALVEMRSRLGMVQFAIIE